MNERRIHLLTRLNTLIQDRVSLAIQLEPFYRAMETLDESDDRYERLEANPKFRPIWLRQQEVKTEITVIMNELA